MKTLLKVFIGILVSGFILVNAWFFLVSPLLRSNPNSEVAASSQKAPGAFEDARFLAITKGTKRETQEGIYAFVYQVSDKQRNVQWTIVYLPPEQMQNNGRPACNMIIITVKKENITIGMRYCIDHEQYQINRGDGWEIGNKEEVLEYTKKAIEVIRKLEKNIDV